ncbi:IL10 protein, partial [Brachypodius atriceps]|nr:IL10 protein [Brachypodius atriceps]
GTALPALLLLLLLGTAPALAQPSCLHFPQLLPAKLKELRVKFEEIKDYFQSKDEDLSIQLLNSDLLEEFKVRISFPCQLLLLLPHPRAGGTGGGDSAGAEVSAGVPLQHSFFTCEESSKSMKNIKETFTRMDKNGIYKAMGEFDIFINYIEKYLTMRRS